MTMIGVWTWSCTEKHVWAVAADDASGDGDGGSRWW